MSKAAALGIEWCPVPGGRFTMGSNPRATFRPGPGELPSRSVVVSGFRLGREPVSNGSYRRFVEATGHRPPGHWPAEGLPGEWSTTPVTYLSRVDAEAYCAWLGARLPTEEEWEVAASGGDGRLWPWGDELPSPERAVSGRAIGGPEPLGGRACGASPFGALDMAGNVLEWTSSSFAPGDARAVARGGAFIHGPGACRCAARHPVGRWALDPYVGFRVALDLGASLPTGLDPASWVEVPGGSYVIGADPVADPFDDCLLDELPAHELTLAPFAIARTPVTNAQYGHFVQAGHPPPPDWPAGVVPRDAEDCPVTWVDWHDACAFAEWVGARLPSEAEWERAARGDDRRRFPWGSEPSAEGRAVVGTGVAGSPAAVGVRADGAGPYGALDLAGNVWEWVSSIYRPYPYDPGDGREDAVQFGERVLRGGSFMSPDVRYARAAFRSRSYPSRRQAHIGFRLACSMP